MLIFENATSESIKFWDTMYPSRVVSYEKHPSYQILKSKSLQQKMHFKIIK